MAYSPIAFTAANYRDYKNYWLKAYEPGTTTPVVMATDSTLSTFISKSEVNVDGFLVSAGNALIIPYVNGTYDLWLFPTEAEAEANDTSNALRLADSITGAADLAEAVTLAPVSETVTLIDGQTVVTFTAQTTAGAEFHINGQGLDSRLLTSLDINEGLTTLATITLFDSYPAGALVTLSKNTSTGSAVVATVEEEVVLTNGQTVVTFSTLTTESSEFHINGIGVDSRLLSSEDINQSLTTPSTITLFESYPAGSIVTLAQNSTKGNINVDITNNIIKDLSQAYEFDTLQDAIVSTVVLPVGKVLNLKERTIGNGGGATWDVVLSGSVTENGYNIVQCTGVPTLSLVMRNNYDSITFRVPSQYPDMQTAIDTYRKTGVSGDYTKVIVYIETGHALTNGLVCEHGDFSFIEITSQDATVLLDVAFTPAVTPNDIPTSNSNPVMFADSCTAPLWSILVDAELKDIAGITYRASNGKISSGAGVNNANRMGLSVLQASVIAAHECSFVNSGDGNRTSTGSTLTAFAANFSNARALTETQAAGMDVSRGSTFNCASNTSQARTNLTGCAKFALNCRRSRISASRADCTGAGENAIRNGYGGFIECDSALLDSSTSHAINSSTGSVMARDASINLCGARGVLVDQGGVVNVSGATITNCTGEALYAFDGGEITANSANVTGFLSTNAVSAFDSSKITANGLVGSPVFAVTPNIITDNGVIMTEAVVSNFGKAIVLNTTSSINVTHGLDFEPNDRTINIMPINALSAQANYYISTVGATTFRINVVGGASGDTQFAWDATSAP